MSIIDKIDNILNEKVEKIGEYDDLIFLHKKGTTNPWVIMQGNKVVYNSKVEKTAKMTWRNMKKDKLRSGVKARKNYNDKNTSLYTSLTTTMTSM